MNARKLYSFVALSLTAIPAVAMADSQGISVGPSAPSADSIPHVLVLPGSRQPDAQVTLNPAKPSAGQPVSVKFTVTNNGSKPVKYDFSSAQQFDVTLRDSKGSDVWRWGQGRMFAANLSHLSLKAGESAVFEAKWPGTNDAGKPVAPGDYSLVARLTPEQRHAITGGILVNPVSDPNNMGVATIGQVERGAVRQVDVTPSVYAVARVKVAHQQ